MALCRFISARQHPASERLVFLICGRASSIAAGLADHSSLKRWHGTVSAFVLGPLFCLDVRAE